MSGASDRIRTKTGETPKGGISMLNFIIGAIAVAGFVGKLMSGSENSTVDSVGQHLENAERKALDGLQKLNSEGEKLQKKYAKKDN